MKVASDVLGDLKVAYVDKTIINKLDNHKPLEDMDALNLIGGGYFQPAIRPKERNYRLPIPFTIITLRKRRNQYKSLIAS